MSIREFQASQLFHAPCSATFCGSVVTRGSPQNSIAKGSSLTDHSTCSKMAEKKQGLDIISNADHRR